MLENDFQNIYVDDDNVLGRRTITIIYLNYYAKRRFTSELDVTIFVQIWEVSPQSSITRITKSYFSDGNVYFRNIFCILSGASFQPY